MKAKIIVLAALIALSSFSNVSIATEISFSTTYSNATETSKLYSKKNKQTIELTVLSESDAKELFNKLRNRDDIPYDYIMDGSFARAHKMSRILEGEGIISGKAFLEGEFYLSPKSKSVLNHLLTKVNAQPYEAAGYAGLGYVVAPIVLVNKNNTPTPYVIDPSFFDEAVPYTTWKQKIISHPKSKIVKEYFTNRFSYDPDDADKNLKDYVDEYLADMNSTNRNTSRILFMIDRRYKNK